MSSTQISEFEPGMKAGEYFGGKFVTWAIPSLATMALGAGTGWFLAIGGGAALAVLPIGHAVWFTQKVPEFTYGVVSREDMVLPITWGSGIHVSLPGDQVFIIKTNPIPVPVTVVRQLMDGREVTLVLQITVVPHAQIANERGVNTYGSWVVEDKGSDAHAKSHVIDAIKQPISGILTNVLGQCNSDELDQWNLGLALLIEGEVALHKAPHHLAGRGTYVIEEHGSKVSKTLPGGFNPTKILKWYSENHAEVRAYLDWADEAFEKALAEGNFDGASHFLSHHEAHVGCVFNAAQVISMAYDEATTKAKKARYIAEQEAAGVAPTIGAINAGTEQLVAKGVSSDTAALLSARAAKVDGVSLAGKIYVGAGKELTEGLIKAEILGDAAGEAITKKGGK